MFVYICILIFHETFMYLYVYYNIYVGVKSAGLCRLKRRDWQKTLWHNEAWEHELPISHLPAIARRLFSYFCVIQTSTAAACSTDAATASVMNIPPTHTHHAFTPRSACLRVGLLNVRQGLFRVLKHTRNKINHVQFKIEYMVRYGKI